MKKILFFIILILIAGNVFAEIGNPPVPWTVYASDDCPYCPDRWKFMKQVGYDVWCIAPDYTIGIFEGPTPVWINRTKNDDPTLLGWQYPNGKIDWDENGLIKYIFYKLKRFLIYGK